MTSGCCDLQSNRAGVHYSAVRRYFTTHKEVLLHLAAEGWVRWSNTVCAALREPGPMSPSRVADTLANGLAADPLFCDLLANLHLHLEHEVDLDRVVEIRRTSTAAVVSLADAIEQALPALGRRTKRPARRLFFGGPLVADRPPAERAGRRLHRGTGGPTRVEPRFRIRAYPTRDRYLRRPPLRIH